MAHAKDRGRIVRALDRIEALGNRLPDPVTLFLLFTLAVLLLSWLISRMGGSVLHPGTGEELRAVNLLTTEVIRRVLVEMPRTFTAFPPLGLVLVVMLGIGVAERSGLTEAALRTLLRGASGRGLTLGVVLAGLLSSIAVDAGYVVVIPMGAVLFHGAGRHPLAGLAAAFAGVSGGFSANLLLTALDPLLAGFTEPAAQLLDPTYRVAPTGNWWIMAALVPVLALTGTLVTERILEPRLGAYLGVPSPAPLAELNSGPDAASALPPGAERRGLRAALAVTGGLLLLVLLLVLPSNSPFRDEGGGLAPLLSATVALMFLAFLLPGIAFGWATGRIRRDRDVVGMMTEAMAGMGAYIVLAFVAAHFIAVFSWSNLGPILAIRGASALEGIGLTGLPLLVAFILVAALLNLLIGSASAKWAIMAPIFVPMLMVLGYSPELTQAAYRIGDSFTNILTPLLPYYPLVIVFAQRYDPEIGIGTLISAMLPYSLAFALVSIPTLVLWILLGLPPGPGAPLLYTP